MTRNLGLPEGGLPHITWPQLRERYELAETFEEKLGLIHATRSAEHPDEGLPRTVPGTDPKAVHEALMFLTEIVDEVDVQAPMLRQQARIILARHTLERVTRLCGRETRKFALHFLAVSPEHTLGLDGSDLEKLHNFLDYEWHRAEPLDRAVLIRASVNARAFALLVKYRVTDAIPNLYRLIAEWVAGSGWSDEPRQPQLGLFAHTWRLLFHSADDFREVRRILGDGNAARELASEEHRILILCGEALRILSPRNQVNVRHLHEAARTLLELLSCFALYLTQDPERVEETERLAHGLRAGCDHRQ